MYLRGVHVLYLIEAIESYISNRVFDRIRMSACVPVKHIKPDEKNPVSFSKLPSDILSY